MFSTGNWFFFAVLLFFPVHADITDIEYDSTPKIFELDDYDKCLNLDTGLYCSIVYKLKPLNPKVTSQTWQLIESINQHKGKYRHDLLRHGVCVTNFYFNKTEVIGKSTAEIKKKINEVYNDKYRDQGLSGDITNITCNSRKDKYEVTRFDTIIQKLFYGYIFFVVLCTLGDYFGKKFGEENYKKLMESKSGKTISVFSLIHNYDRLTTINTQSPLSDIRAFQGTRILLISIIILAHNVMVISSGPIQNTAFVEHRMDSLLAMVLSNGVVSVQIFFVMSLWLLTYFILEKFHDQETFSFNFVLLAILQRYLRLTPVLLVQLLFHLTWLRHMSTGPFWDEIVGTEYRNCWKNWWKNLLYINNLGYSQDMCLQQSWYLSSDTFYFILGLMYLWAVWKFKKYYLQILGSIFVVYSICVFFVAYKLQIDVRMPGYPEDLYMLRMLFSKSVAVARRVELNTGGFFVGLAFGYIYFKFKGKSISNSITFMTVAWFTFFAFLIGPLSVPGLFFIKKDWDPESPFIATYIVVARPLFACSGALALFLMSKGQGWILKYVLESRFAVGLARIAYCLSMVHITFNYVRAGRPQVLAYASEYQILTETTADTVFSLFGALAMALFVEYPAAEIVKIIIPKKKGTLDNGKNGSISDTLRESNKKTH